MFSHFPMQCVGRCYVLAEHGMRSACLLYTSAKVYTTDVVVEEHEFAESKAASGNGNGGGQQTQGFANYGGYQGEPAVGNDGFMNIPDGLDEELPFN